MVTNFVVAPIVDLLTPERFPNDTNIAAKVALIKQAWEKYTNAAVICFGNCTSSANGVCQPTGYFNFGLCSCFDGWNRDPLECSLPPLTTTTPLPPPSARRSNINRKKKRIHALRMLPLEDILN